MSRISQNIATILNTERIIVRHQVRTALKNGVLFAVAGLITVIGLAMLNVAAFFWLRESQTPGTAAFLVALGDFVVAGVLMLFADRRNPDRHIEPVIELRDMAMAELKMDVDHAIDDARGLSRDLRRMARDPLGTALPSLLGPLLALLLSSRKK